MINSREDIRSVTVIIKSFKSPVIKMSQKPDTRVMKMARRILDVTAPLENVTADKFKIYVRLPLLFT